MSPSPSVGDFYTKSSQWVSFQTFPNIAGIKLLAPKLSGLNFIALSSNLMQWTWRTSVEVIERNSPRAKEDLLLTADANYQICKTKWEHIQKKKKFWYNLKVLLYSLVGLTLVPHRRPTPKSAVDFAKLNAIFSQLVVTLCFFVWFFRFFIIN